MNWNLTKEVIEAVVKHQSKQIALAVAAVCLILLVLLSLPIEFLQRLQVYRAWIFVIFLFAACYLPAGAVLRKVEKTFSKRAWHQRLHRLTPEEKRILSLFVEPHRRSQTISRADAVAKGLADDSILYAPDVPATQTGEISYNIQDWVMTYLRDHRELLQIGGLPK